LIVPFLKSDYCDVPISGSILLRVFSPIKAYIGENLM
jgi:hypothetical protein